MERFNDDVLQTLISVTDAAAHVDFKQWLQNSTWDCQKSCLRHVFDQSIGTMWSTGQLFDNTRNGELMLEAFTGGFKACYPTMPRMDALALTNEVVRTVMKIPEGRRLRGETPHAADGLRRLAFYDCNYFSTTKVGKKWLKNFVAEFSLYIQKAYVHTPTGPLIFNTAKDCQHTCAHHTLKRTMETFWDTGIIADQANRSAWAQIAITGALKACYPSLPRDDVQYIVSDIMGSMTLVDNLPAASPPVQLYEAVEATTEGASVRILGMISNHATAVLMSVGVVGLLASLAITRWLPPMGFPNRESFLRVANSPTDDEPGIE